MDTIVTSTQGLVQFLLGLMPSIYQSDSLESLIGLFLQANGYPLPQHCQTKSPSAISRFLNIYKWPTRRVIRAIRNKIVELLLAKVPPGRKGRKPLMEVVIDLTTLEKVGKFKGLNNLIRVYNGKRGLHILVLYILLGNFRIPWGFRVYRGKGEKTPVELAQNLIRTIPKKLTDRFQVRILADTGFGSIEMLKWVHERKKIHAIIGIRNDRRLKSGSHVSQIVKRGQQVYLQGMDFPVTLSWYWLKKEDGKKEKRFVVSTKPLSGRYIIMIGRRRWQIEGFFKTAKHRFGLHKFGQGTLLGVYRWLLLSLIAYLLAHWAYLSTGLNNLPSWGEVARLALENYFPQLVVMLLLIDIKRTHSLARQQGLDITVSSWPYG